MLLQRLEPWASYLALSADFARIAPYLEKMKIRKRAIYQVMQAAIYDNLIDKTFFWHSRTLTFI